MQMVNNQSDDELTTLEAGIALECTTPYVMHLVSKGLLPSRKEAGRLLIPRQAVMDYLAGKRDRALQMAETISRRIEAVRG